MNKFIIILVVVLIIITYFSFKQKPITIFNSYYVKGYNDLKYRSSFNYTQAGITKIIIKTSWHKRESLPEKMISALKISEELNPDYTLYYFDNDEIDQFMSDFSPVVFNYYRKLVPGAFKADLFRACCLYRFGGCYSDIGHIMLKPFDMICGDANIVLVSDYKVYDVGLFVIKNVNYTGIHNALMCCVKEHPFFKALIDKTCENIANNYYGENPLDITGPTMIGKVFNCYFGNKCDYINENIMKYGISDYNCDKCKIKILKLTAKLYVPKFTFYIQDIHGNDLVRTKFDNYYEVMYHSKKTPKYGELWDKRKVYK